MLFNKWKLVFPKLIFCHNADKNGNTKWKTANFELYYLESEKVWKLQIWWEYVLGIFQHFGPAWKTWVEYPLKTKTGKVKILYPTAR